MSKTALNEYNSARERQLTRNDARRIRARVEEAQQNPGAASLRWPFELMQNAHDAGPRNGAEFVEVVFRFREGDLIVSHTGKSFSAQELAALLSGGSSKEFDDLETTGRFGTGFLATHALSTRVDVKGRIETQEGFEQFTIQLDRGGDEDSISENIDKAAESISEAIQSPVSSPAEEPTASFIYRNANSSVVERGLDRLKAALPYLFGTCRKLGKVSIESPDGGAWFVRGETFVDRLDGFTVETTEIEIAGFSDESQVRIVRMGETDADSALLVFLSFMDGNTPRFVAPAENFPRLFLQFPISETGSLPFNVIIDGLFTPKQERDGIAMNDGDRNLIGSALLTLPVLVEYAVDKKWKDITQLVRIAAPERSLGGESAADETTWWKDTVLKIAEKIARKPIVQTPTGRLPAVSENGGNTVSFLVPSISNDAEESIAFERIYGVVSVIKDIHVASIAAARDWEQISREWEDMGVAVDRLGFKEITDWIKERTDTVDAIPVTTDPFGWLADLFLLGAEMNDNGVDKMVNGLLPNQDRKFCDTRKVYLYEDTDVPEEVKDIADVVGMDLKSRLLHDRMAKNLTAPGFGPAKDLVWGLLDKQGKDEGYDESAALEEIIKTLKNALPDDRVFSEDSDLPSLRASACLVQYLWKSDSDQYLRECPLLTSAAKVVRLTGSQQILAPISHWPDSAKPYADLYTERRVLSDRYCEHDTIRGALDSLIAAGLVLAAPLYRAVRPEIEDNNLLNAMSKGPLGANRVAVRDESFGQIAFLSTDLVQRCGQDGDLAKLLLEFVLSVAAREDHSWRDVKKVEGHRPGEVIPLSLHGATWPFELKVRSWVPVQIPDGEGFQAMPANESNLRDMLDPAWLRGNPDAMKLLHQVFGFRQFALILHSLDSEEIEDDLVTLLQRPELLKFAAQNPEALAFASELDSAEVQLDSMRTVLQDFQEDEDLPGHLAERREQRRRVHENQSLGGHVETLVRMSLEESGFTVHRTGRGSDYEISAGVDDVAELAVVLGDRTWLVEVKSTHDQRVRMTDTQARTAVAEDGRYLLCVVPVDAGSTLPELDDVRTAMRFVQNVGTRLQRLCNELGEFEERRNEITSEASEGVQLEISTGAVRVRVDGSVWENDGFPLEELPRRLVDMPDG